MLGLGPAPGAGAAEAGGLHWRPCAGRFQCATLQVPLSYGQPSLGHLGLAVVRLPASGPGRPLGDVVLNFGGPGEPGVAPLEQGASQFPAALRRRFALVSFDPRGVGGSDPVHCSGPAGVRALISANPDPTTPAQVAAVARVDQAFVADCRAHTPASLLDRVSTADAARDLDRLRAALGQPKLTYLGFSYGTQLGAVYAQEFPDRVRALVLDGAVDPNLSAGQEWLAQAVGFQHELSDFEVWARTHAPLDHGPAPSRVYATVMGRLAQGKATAQLTAALGGDQPVTLGMGELGVIAALYEPSTWPDVARALQQAARGDATVLAAFALQYAGFGPTGLSSNVEAANTAIDCLDQPVPTSLSYFSTLAARAERQAPAFGGAAVWSSLSCAFWPVRPATTPVTETTRAPVLVVGSTGDPATPYAWATALAALFPRGVLLTRRGAGHTGYLASTCVQRAADHYLATLALPARGTVCAS
jgi:pimeloyl-ACP methyl ester carboxylesterase